MHRSIRGVGVLFVLGLLTWQARPASDAARPRAVWLWDPKPVLTDAAARTAALDFLGRERVSVIWAQVGLEKNDVAGAPSWRSFMADAAARGISVEALSGDPSWAISQEGAKRVLEAVLAYNVSSAAPERFRGVHFDIEPHQLWSWQSARKRRQVLRNYLDLLAWCKERISLEAPGMKLGADIPFWWQAKEARSSRAIGETEFAGATKAASFHAIDLLDNVGIMSYRNRADGPNGMVAISQDLLTYADRAGKAALWMGVETSRDRPGSVWFAVGLPNEVMESLLDTATDITEGRQYKGYRISVFDDGRHTHLGLTLPDAERDRPSRNFVTALQSLARSYGLASRPALGAQQPDIQAGFLRRMARDAEWQDPQARVITDPESGKEFAGVFARSIMPASLTFDGLSAEAFRRETDAAERAFSKHASYRGLALHHFDSLRSLLSRPAPAQAGWPHDVP